ncbi:hypothetical protein VNI00_001432 [Paramarasmius palmivorus]|uniref:Uncharacterized protein n=1 Tax=Paramarasmius palmivorus TaxID=297713 RepID=A0AAW0E0Y7_9AGAR
MPSCRRKRVVLIEPSPSLLQAAKTNPNKKVFFLHQTGEIFETYEAYAARMSFYRLKQFQCEVTGKSGLDYFQALESERQEARTLHARFPEPLKPVILKAVQWQVMSRLDHLVEAVYERYKDRYFKGEKVVVDLSGNNVSRYHAIVDRVYPPRYHTDAKARDQYDEAQEKSESIHAIEGDLKIPIKDVVARDDPALYYYWVQILEPERDRNDKAKAASAKQPEANDNSVVGSLMEVQCVRMSRDRLAFSKSILRRFIRDCVDRDAAVASPWTVKPEIAKRYGMESEMPEETRKDVENMKKGESDKRKKAWEDKELPPSKKQKKMAAAQEEKAKAAVAAAEKRDREEQERVEAERLAAEKKKKKPIRYPTEDLDVRIGDKEKKAGMKVKRPVPSRIALPFNDTHGTFEQFLLSWNFLVVHGQPLHLSPFTLDEFEHAIRHSLPDLPCNLLAEVHSTLIYNLRTVPFHRHSAILSLLRQRDQTDLHGGTEEKLLGITIDELTGAMADVGNNWERVPLRSSEGREGWEDALIGCLKDHATTENFPRLREILTKLLFAPETPSDEGSPSSSSSTLTPETPNPGLYTVSSTPAERYPTLTPQDRLAILSFMCNLAVSSKAIHAHMESCEEQLTALRKEKIEVNRLKKQNLEEMSNLQSEMKEDPDAQVGDGDISMQDSPDASASESGTEAPKKGTSRQKDLQKKAQLQAHAKQREAARAKQASIKQAMAEHRRLDEDVNKIERRLEGIERDFRKLLGGVRVKPMGKDRFYNRIWWFDGMGSGSLVGSGGVAQYGTGRIFIQGPSEFDLEILQRREEDITARRQEEEGVEGMLGPGDWAVYSDIEELDEFVAWLNPKGHRELALKTALGKWWIHITAGIRRRLADVNANTKQPEARRSTRTKANYDVSREPYMTWSNRRAINAS